jgi:hypothetical protein
MELKKWQSIANEFLISNLNEVEFCNKKRLNVKDFRHMLREVEDHEEKLKDQNVESMSKDLFIELLPQVSDNPEPVIQKNLQLKFRGVSFELAPGFSVEVFRQALQVVKENV